MNRKCVICDGGHSEWVDEQHKAGVSTREIAKALEAEFGLSVSHVTVSSHLNHGDKSDRTAVLERRIRNLEVWMGSALPPETFLTWSPKIPRSGDASPHTISYRNSYIQTIPNPETIKEESLAILSTISAEMDRDEAERDRQQKEVWAQEKAERDRLAKIAHDEQEVAREKAREKAERIKIESMREQVNAYDNGEVTIS